MEINVTKNENVTLLEIFKNGQPVNQANSVDKSDLENFQYPDGASGEIAIVSGFPLWANATVVAAAKNQFSVVACYDPKEKGGVVIHSVSPNYRLGAVIPLG